MSTELPKQKTFPSSKQFTQINLHQAFATLQNCCSTMVQNLSQLTLFNLNPSSFQNLQAQTKHAIDTTISHLNPPPLSLSKNPFWARIATQLEPIRQSRAAALPTETIEERLAGVPVYALSNPNEEFVLVTGASTGKSLGLLCFKKEDAEVLLEQMKSMDPSMRKSGSKVVPVALNKLKVQGVAFRLIPESSQVKNALKEREKAGFSDDAFPGVPVFQSRSLVLKSENKSYRPVFFRKEDLEKSLLRASRQQKKLNPAFRQGDIQVAVFEEIIKSMKESSTSTWDDVVFIPPGFDVSTGTA
ncbi:protein TIC 22-like, chloroplastic isoform X2 [Ricinus communis]|uniref:protein TIC 22-like, chloroplastic isoform X2 n=1 Tax=Ricinus communis TaxID=3988 RepID=UPI00201AF06C|nr:protein TIC 22-like, chloroplastic isoform X2 [Ricinus communis]